MNPHEGADCPMANTLGMLGDRWSLLIVREALAGAVRYDDFRQRLEISDHTLSRKLQMLVDIEVLERREFTTPAGYGLSPAGEALTIVLAALGSWNQRWYPVANPRTPPQAVEHALEKLRRLDTL